MDFYTQQLKTLAAPLLAWYDKNRRVLPWREVISPYRTWVSEIMLQQTRVAAVLPYFERFMAHYPTVEALAGSDEEELMKLWEGLGYYSRARNLRKAAAAITEQHGGDFPQTYAELTALPGIGDYTAGAILSIAFGQAVPAVDGNVLRVFSRITGFDGDISDAKNRKMIRACMAEAMPADRPGAFNQALMDLGATVCLPNSLPLCQSCPAREFCAARETGKQSVLPVRAPKKTKKIEEKTVFFLIRGGEIALRQREKTGLLAGLWEFPNVEGHLDEAAAAQCLADWHLTPRNWQRSVQAKHIFTHIIWDMRGYAVEVSGSGAADFVWCDAAALREKAIPSAFELFKKDLKTFEGD